MARSGSPHLDRRTIPFSGCCRTSCKAFLNNLSERWQSAPCAAQRVGVAEAWPKCLQDGGRIQGNCANGGGHSRTAKTLGIKRLSPEAARHHQLRNTRQSGSIPVARSSFGSVGPPAPRLAHFIPLARVPRTQRTGRRAMAPPRVTAFNISDLSWRGASPNTGLHAIEGIFDRPEGVRHERRPRPQLYRSTRGTSRLCRLAG